MASYGADATRGATHTQTILNRATRGKHMEYYRHVKQIVLEDVRAVGLSRTIVLYLTTAATIGLWFLAILFI